MKKLLYTTLTLLTISSCVKEKVVKTINEKPLSDIALEGYHRNIALRYDKSKPYILYINFDGGVVQNTSWNANGPFTVNSCSLTQQQKETIIQQVTDIYSPFNVIVTADQSVYNATEPYQRLVCMVTDSYEWYGNQAGGVSYINSYSWGDNSPCFVFSSLLKNNTKNIWNAVAHEAGHMFGLRHQAQYDNNGNKLSDYNPGYGTGNISFGPIMGVPYNDRICNWFVGKNPYNGIQRDFDIVAGAVGVASDDFVYGFEYKGTSISSSFTGVINDSTDTDIVPISINGLATITATSNFVDIKLSLYDQGGRLLTSNTNELNTDATITNIGVGTYYLKIEGTSNANMDSKFMTGKYYVNIQTTIPLPINMDSFKATVLPNNEAQITFTTYNSSQDKSYTIQVYNDDKKVWEDIEAIPADGDKQYSATININ